MADPNRAMRRLIDTSVWIRADRKRDSQVSERLKTLLRLGAARVCWPVRAELLVGVKDEQQWATLDDSLSAIDHVPVTENTWRLASKSGWKLARRGQTVPIVDLIIAAAAIEADLVLWTVDSDFDRIADVSPLQLDRFDQ